MVQRKKLLLHLERRKMKNDDLRFVDTLYAQQNANIGKRQFILFIVIISFFTAALVWAYFSPIDELARGEGKVIPSKKIQKIQSLDGGIVSDILVKEGGIIEKGQPLLKIDTTRYEATYEENKRTYNHMLITKKRLELESTLDIEKKIPEYSFSKDIEKEAKEFIQSDYKLFISRVSELRSTVDILKIQLEQKRQELTELRSKRDQLKKDRELTKRQRDTVEELVAKKAQSKIELIKIDKELSKLEGELNAVILSIPRAKYSITEVENRIKEKSKIFKSEALNQLQKVNTDIEKYRSKLISEKDKIDKTVLYSPVDGIIKQININSIGEVIRSGYDLMEIVPGSTKLLVEAKISPKDIAFINPRQKAIVKITAYDFSIYGGLDGKIVEISADSIVDKDSQDKKTYYKVVIETEKNYLEKHGEKFPIIPGMIASVDIITGKKTIFDFIMKPLLKTKDNALHER
jgi:adhesin transport system membrane fusion protein